MWIFPLQASACKHPETIGELLFAVLSGALVCSVGSSGSCRGALISSWPPQITRGADRD